MLGGIAAVTLVGILFFLIGRSRKSATEKSTATTPATPATPATNPTLGTGTTGPATQPFAPPGYYRQGYGEDWRAKGLTPPTPQLSPNPSYNPHAAMYGSPPPPPLSPTHPHYNPHPSIYGPPPPPLSPTNPYYNLHYGNPPPPLNTTDSHYNPYAAMYGSPPPPPGPTNPRYNSHMPIYGGPPLTNSNRSSAPPERGGENASQPERAAEFSTANVGDRAPSDNAPEIA